MGHKVTGIIAVWGKLPKRAAVRALLSMVAKSARSLFEHGYVG